MSSNYLESKGIEQRHDLIDRNRYTNNDDNKYGIGHEDSVSNGDALGKGDPNSSGGHGHTIPNVGVASTSINYSNTINTYSNNIGGLYDINGRNGIGGREKLMNMSLYNKNRPYGIDSIDTSSNRSDGQIIIRYDK